METFKETIDRLKAENAQLTREVNWLADYLCDIACTRDVKPCQETMTCRECWKQEAKRKTENGYD